MTVDPLQAVAKSPKDAFRKFVPKFLLQQRGIVRRLGPGAGRVYGSLRLLDMLGIRIANRRMAPASARSFLFVCFGNLMRSAMAEFAMRQALRYAGLEDQVRVLSAGLHASPGREAHPWAQQAAAEVGISLADHRAKLVTREIVEQADCIFAMDFQNKAELLTLYPDARKKILMLSAYAEGPSQYREIDDPYFGDLETTRLCCQQLQTCVRNLAIRTFPSSADAISQITPKK